ncbi:MAG: hypothetical protein EOM41_08490 [Bacilli bacterium]|nr:hypothetical protein [Bacilli bacterium]
MTYNPLSQLYRTFPAIIDPSNTENSLVSQIPKTVLFDILERLKALEVNQDTGTSGDAVWGSITGNLQNQTDLTNKLATKANAATVSTELANKADKSTVTAELAQKADTATVITDLATKADVATVNTELDKKADKTTVDASLAKKADTVTVNSALTAKADSMMVTTELAKKADKTVVDAALAKKADTTTVTSELAKKADTATVNDALATKADAATVTTELATKAEKTTVDAALATKADAATVTVELATKADAATVTVELAKKADKTTVDATLAKKAPIIDYDNKTLSVVNQGDNQNPLLTVRNKFYRSVLSTTQFINTTYKGAIPVLPYNKGIGIHTVTENGAASAPYRLDSFEFSLQSWVNTPNANTVNYIIPLQDLIDGVKLTDTSTGAPNYWYSGGYLSKSSFPDKTRVSLGVANSLNLSLFLRSQENTPADHNITVTFTLYIATPL